MSILEYIRKFHFKCQQGMYFSEYIELPSSVGVFSSIVEDTGWNFIAPQSINSSDELKKLWNEAKKLFNVRKRTPAINISDDYYLEDEIKNYFINNFEEEAREAWQVFKNIDYFEKFTSPENCKIIKIDNETQADLFVNTFTTSKSSVRPGDPFEKLPEYYSTALRNSFENYKESDYIVRHYLTIYDGEPAGIGTSISKDGIAGIYGIGTYANLRAKGLGTYLMKRIVWDLLDEKNKIIFLCTAKDSYVEKWYEKIGFETVGTSIRYVENKD